MPGPAHSIGNFQGSYAAGWRELAIITQGLTQAMRFESVNEIRHISTRVDLP